MFPHDNNASSVGLLGDCEPVKRLPVRRNLFGTPTPEKQNEDFLTQEIRLKENESKENFKRRWGFDLDTETPVENGPYTWTPAIEDDTPKWYLKAYAHRPGKSRPVHSPRRERPYDSTVRHYQRHLKRAHDNGLQLQQDENNVLSSDIHFWRKRSLLINEDCLLTTPKPLRLPTSLLADLSTSSASQNSLPSSTIATVSSTSLCSIDGLRSHPVSSLSSSSSPSSRKSNLKQQTIDGRPKVLFLLCLLTSLYIRLDLSRYNNCNCKCYFIILFSQNIQFLLQS